MTTTKRARNKLEITTPNDREIVMTRVFNAPRPLVFDAWTKPELLRRWMGVHAGWTFAVCDVDLRVGGSYRFVWRGPDGMEMGMGGTYLAVDPPKGLSNTERFDQSWYDGAATGTLELVDMGPVTTSINTVRYESKAVRDAVLASPMESGMVAGYNALDDVLASL